MKKWSAAKAFLIWKSSLIWDSIKQDSIVRILYFCCTKLHKEIQVRRDFCIVFPCLRQWQPKQNTTPFTKSLACMIVTPTRVVWLGIAYGWWTLTICPKCQKKRKASKALPLICCLTWITLHESNINTCNDEMQKTCFFVSRLINSDVKADIEYYAVNLSSLSNRCLLVLGYTKEKINLSDLALFAHKRSEHLWLTK